MYLRETKIWWCEEGGEEGEEKVHLLTHATAWGMGKKFDRTAAGKEEDQLGFGVLIHSCIVHNDFSLPSIPVHKDFSLQENLP